MSRIGKKPIPVPKGVTVAVKDGAIEVKGPKGTVTQGIPPGVKFALCRLCFRQLALDGEVTGVIKSSW